MTREPAERPGENIIKAAGDLRERFDRVRRPGSASLAGRLTAIGRDCAGRLNEPYRSIDHGDLLYDKKGLPQ